MREESVQELLRAWREANSSTEEFLEEMYLSLHQEGSETTKEKREVIRRRIALWRGNIRKMDANAARYPEEPELKTWQASEMLDNVIRELEMTLAEEYQYLLNVKLLCSFRLHTHLPSAEAEAAQGELEAEYDKEWDRAVYASESERTELYARTVQMMQHAGITYEDDTRRILAEIGAGRQVQFPESTKEEREAICLLTSFLASEIVLAEAKKEENLSSEDQALLVEHAVPLYTAAAALTQEGRDPGSMERLAQTELGMAAAGKSLSLLLTAAVAYTAVQTVFLAVKLAIAGAAVALGLKALRGIWKAVYAEKRSVVSRELLLPPQRRALQGGGAEDDIIWEHQAELAENRIKVYE